MALAIPATFTLANEIFGALNGIGGILISMRKCYKGHNNTSALFARAESSLLSIRQLVKEVSVFVVLGGFSMESFSFIELR